MTKGHARSHVTKGQHAPPSHLINLIDYRVVYVVSLPLLLTLLLSLLLLFLLSLLLLSSLLQRKEVKGREGENKLT